jgi:hypothetical protein
VHGPAGKIFGGITNEDIAKQVTSLVEKGKALESDNGMIGKRLATLANKYAQVADLPVALPGSFTEASKAFDEQFGITSGSFLGGTLKEKIYNAQKLTKLNHVQAKKVALLNDGSDDTKLILPKSFTQEQIKAFTDAHPGKKLKLVVASKALEDKFGQYGVANAHELWHKSFHELASQPLAHPVLKPALKKFTVSPSLKKSDGIHTSKEAKIGGGVKTYVSKAYWAEFESQYSNEYHDEKHFYRPPLVSDAELKVKEMETGNGNYGDKTSPHLSSIAKSAADTWGGSPTSIHEAELHDKTSGTYGKYAAAIQQAWKDPNVPKYHGVAYRGLTGIEPGTHSYEQFTTPGNVVEFNASQGATRRATLSFANRPFVMRVATKSGISIEQDSGHIGEREMWLAKGTRWRVVAVAYNVVFNNAVIKTFVDLEEIVTK